MLMLETIYLMSSLVWIHNKVPFGAETERISHKAVSLADAENVDHKVVKVCLVGCKTLFNPCVVHVLVLVQFWFHFG